MATRSSARKSTPTARKAAGVDSTVTDEKETVVAESKESQTAAEAGEDVTREVKAPETPDAAVPTPEPRSGEDQLKKVNDDEDEQIQSPTGTDGDDQSDPEPNADPAARIASLQALAAGNQPAPAPEPEPAPAPASNGVERDWTDGAEGVSAVVTVDQIKDSYRKRVPVEFDGEGKATKTAEYDATRFADRGDTITAPAAKIARLAQLGAVKEIS